MYSATAQNTGEDEYGVASQNGVDIIPASPATAKLRLPKPDVSNGTYAPINLTPDKSELVRLDGEAASVIIGNPQHLTALAENTRTLVLIPRLPGATYFTVLDKDANIIMQRHVIVAGPQEKYMRIRKSCAGAGDDCQATQVFYCPGACHEIGLSTGDEETSVPDASAMGAGGNNTNDQDNTATPMHAVTGQ